MRETYAPRLLSRKTDRLRKETSNPRLRSSLASSTPQAPHRLILRAIIRPAKMLFFSPIVFIFSLLMGLAYGLMYLLYTSISEVYENTYHFSIGLSGVAYLGAGIGTFIGLGIIMYSSDKIAVRLAKAKGGEILPEMRLPPMIWGYLPFPAGFLIFGWTTQYKVQWIVPILANGLTGIGVIFVYVSYLPLSFPSNFTLYLPLPLQQRHASTIPKRQHHQNPFFRTPLFHPNFVHSTNHISPYIQLPVQIYLVDSYPRYAASSLAAVSFFRSLLGAVLPLAGNSLEENLGLGVGYTVLAAVAVAFWPVGIAAYLWGAWLRARFPVRL